MNVPACQRVLWIFRHSNSTALITIIDFIFPLDCLPKLKGDNAALKHRISADMSQMYTDGSSNQIFLTNSSHSDPLLKRSPPCHPFSAVACRLHGRHAPWEELNPHILWLKKARTGEQEAGDLVMAPMGSELVVEVLENRLVWVINGQELRRRSEGETCVARLCNLNTQYCRGSKRIHSIPWFGYSEFLIFIPFGI